MRPAAAGSVARAGLAAAAVLVAGAGGCSSEGITAAESGFDVARDGASLPNFPGVVASVTVDANAARRLFGDRVCASLDDQRCVLTAEAEAWVEDTNTATRGGLCEGFAAISHLSWSGLLDLGPFGGRTLAEIQREGNPSFDKELAYWFSTQFSRQVRDATRLVTAIEAATELSETLAQGKGGETFRVGIVRIENGRITGGHALTPYALEADGEGKWRIVAYDSNFPGEARNVLIDTIANTWTYVGSELPGEPQGFYSGGPGNRNPLYLTPNRIRIGKQPCHFCSGEEDGDALTFGGALSVEVEDGTGRKAGEGPDGLYSEIPGLQVMPTIIGRFGRDHGPYTFSFARPTPLTIRATFEPGRQGPTDDIWVRASRPGRSSVLRGRGYGGSHTLAVTGDSVRYSTGTRNGGPLQHSVTTPDGGSITVGVEVQNSVEGLDLRIAIDPATRTLTLEIDARGAASAKVRVKVVDRDANEQEAIFNLDHLPRASLTLQTEDLRDRARIEAMFEEGSAGTAVVSLPRAHETTADRDKRPQSGAAP